MKKSNLEDISTKHSVRGKLIVGKVIKMKSKKTAHIEITRTKYIPKYERYLVKKSKFAVHVPEDVIVSVGDSVLCGETKKISKTKSMIIIKKIDPVIKKTNVAKPIDGDSK